MVKVVKIVPYRLILPCYRHQSFPTSLIYTPLISSSSWDQLCSFYKSSSNSLAKQNLFPQATQLLLGLQFRLIIIEKMLLIKGNCVTFLINCFCFICQNLSIPSLFGYITWFLLCYPCNLMRVFIRLQVDDTSIPKFTKTTPHKPRISENNPRPWALRRRPTSPSRLDTVGQGQVCDDTLSCLSRRKIAFLPLTELVAIQELSQDK